MHTLRSFSGILLSLALAAGVTGCSVFENPSAPPAPVAPAANTLPTTSTSGPGGGSGGGSDSAAEQQIAKNWAHFFSGKSGASLKESLVQDGPQFLATIQGQASTTMAESTVAQVSKVTLVSPTVASVSYSILLAGQPALPNQIGQAVLENGTWKVSAATFCTLLSLENGGSKSGLPQICQTASGSGSAG